jgi:hypothetical protein
MLYFSKYISIESRYKSLMIEIKGEIVGKNNINADKGCFKIIDTEKIYRILCHK